MIGLGVLSLDHPHAAGNHLPALRYLKKHICVTAIEHDNYLQAAEWLNCFSASYCKDRDTLLARDDVDAVLVTSVNSSHAADSIAVAAAGKDVFCDKPVSVTLDEARDIVRAVRKSHVCFITTFPVRYNTSVRQLKRAVDDGELGRIHAIAAANHGCMYEPGQPEWVRDPSRNGGGCLIDHTVHVADIIRWITGAEFAWVKAETSTALRPIPAEDLAIMHGEMTDGTVYQIDASWSRRDSDPMWGDVTFRVIGTKGSAVLDLYNNQKIEIYKKGIVEFGYPDYLCREHGEIFLDYAMWKEYGKKPQFADEVDGLRTVELVSAAYESVSENKRVKVCRWDLQD